MKTAATRYEESQTNRNIYLDRGRTAAKLTIPYLLPESNDPTSSDTDTHVLPWNGIGAKGVLNLASRTLLALLPPTELFFRLTLNEAQVQKLGGMPPDKRTEIEQALVVLEQQILRGIEASGDRVVIHEMLLHLFVVGNALMYLGDDGSRCFHLNRYVCNRDPMGNPVDVVACEEVAYNQLSEKVLAIVDEDAAKDRKSQEEEDSSRTVRVYTWIKWEKNRVRWHQEVKGRLIPGTEGSSPLNTCPWLPLRMTRVDGSAYSPSFVEMATLADLNTAESLQQSVIECASILAIVRFLVKPGGTTNARTLANAANGDFVPGELGDVGALQTQKTAELQAAMVALERVEQRLEASFLLASPRNSERTTAMEIRLMALELERGLGAIYSILADEFQRPYVERRLYLETKAGGLPELDGDLVQPVLTTGVNALGRGAEVQRLQEFIQALAQIPEGMGMVNLDELGRRLANGLGIQTKDLIKSKDQIAQEQQAAQQAQMAQQAMTSPMADPQKLAMAAQAMQGMGQGGPPPGVDAEGPAEDQGEPPQSEPQQ